MTSAYETFKQYFNQAISGKYIDGVLYAISQGDEYNIKNSDAMFLNMFVKTASGQYLDTLAGNYGIIRPNNIGVKDEIIKRIICETLNDHTISNNLLTILDIYFSQFQTKAWIESKISENYTLSDGDNLIVVFDNNERYEFTFLTDNFRNIGNATAEEVADVITQKLHDLNSNGFAVSYYDINSKSKKVRILSNTKGPRSRVSVLGGKANNILQFSTLLNTTQTTNTEFTISNPIDNIFRFTWTNGPNPNLGIVKQNDYVNIFGSNFDFLNKGTFTITKVVNGSVGNAYFEINNEKGISQIVVLLQATDLMFFYPEKKVVTSNQQYATLYEVKPQEIDVIIPVSTTIIERTPFSGGAYIAEVFYTLNHGPGTFTVGETVYGDTSGASGIVLSSISGLTILGMVYGKFLAAENIIGEESDLSVVLISFSTQLDTSVQGNYLIDFNSFIYTNTSTKLDQIVIQGTNGTSIKLLSTNNFPDIGVLVIDLGYDTEETLVPFVKVLNSTEIIIDSSYVWKFTHAAGTDVTLLFGKNRYASPGDGTDFGSYLTDVANARQSAIDYLKDSSAAGIKKNITVLYPSDLGLGNYGKIYSDKYKVWGPDYFGEV